MFGVRANWILICFPTVSEFTWLQELRRFRVGNCHVNQTSRHFSRPCNLACTFEINTWARITQDGGFPLWQLLALVIVSVMSLRDHRITSHNFRRRGSCLALACGSRVYSWHWPGRVAQRGGCLSVFRLQRRTRQMHPSRRPRQICNLPCCSFAKSYDVSLFANQIVFNAKLCLSYGPRSVF